MVFYECVLSIKNHAEFWRLTDLMKAVSHEVVKNGGIVRGIHNHGIREAPHRFKAKFADNLGRRYYEKVRFVSVYMDCNPQTRMDVERVITADEMVLRQTHLRARSLLDDACELSPKKNPFLRQVMEEQAAQKQEKEEEEVVSIF
eukprot:CAMPEP_0172456570 /NCGR_PEP_ID=MMETSP1065-20121228/16383_1 /TAXON_ID=265537 /ORGANISM="Amphiprora paludosa, Strain CCMP125" /LENGTH=144 /DNA_ID=CAMNT_0013209675 /DNA_START=44 /DNA_END=478 /DNA_ORIENTATION=-